MRVKHKSPTSHCFIKIHFHLFGDYMNKYFFILPLADEILKVAKEYSEGDGSVKINLEKRYGKRRLEQILEESRSESMLTNMKRCPSCTAYVEVSLIFVNKYAYFLYVCNHSCCCRDYLICL